MEKIGDFSKRCDVTIKTLRYYDKLGLLVPDYIDKYTGYRYYGTEKISEMQRITELKDIGFSLEEIKSFCSAEKDDEKYKVVWKKRQELEKLMADTSRQLHEVTKLEEELDSSSTVKRGEEIMKSILNFNAEFENDEMAVGHWEVIDTVARKEDFSPETPEKGIFTGGAFFPEIYFLPGGQEYWAFSWTKGYVKLSSGDGKMLCPYEIEETGGELYMFMKYHESLIVLKQTDKKHYTKYEIGQHDNIDMPFVNDERVLGKWSAVDFVREISDFDPSKQNYTSPLFYKSTEFLQNGELHCVMGNSFKAKWTNGATLLKTGDGTTAPAYEIRSINGTEYLFIEWKSGDYVWGRMKPCYYVFKRGEAV